MPQALSLGNNDAIDCKGDTMTLWKRIPCAFRLFILIFSLAGCASKPPSNELMELLNLPELQGGTDEGYTREEIAECLVLLNRRDEATPYFTQAWELLHDDPWLQRDEPARLDRLKQLGKQTSRN